MIGFIALAGIIVRNSILLVEFARAQVSAGMTVDQAITLAARVRLRPILITALALVIGSMVLLSDPIFQGMAVSLLFGSLVATFLTLVVIPLGCISAHKYVRPRDDGGDDGPPVGSAPPPVPPVPPLPEDTPSVAPAVRPQRLVKRTDQAPAGDGHHAVVPEAASPGRPPKLLKRTEQPLADEFAQSAAPEVVPTGRPRRLLKRTERDAEVPLTPDAAMAATDTATPAGETPSLPSADSELPSPSTTPPSSEEKG
jgi:hypothetical protein